MARVAETSPRRSGPLEELVARYGRLIRAAVAKVVGRHGGSLEDDVEQRVMVALWKKIDGEQAIDHPATYIYRSAVREAVRAVRQEQARAAEELDEQVAEPGPAPEQALAAQELGRTVARCAAALGEERRRAVSAHLAGFSVEEIMEMQGWPYQKARNLIARGMADLRERLRAEGVDLD